MATTSWTDDVFETLRTRGSRSGSARSAIVELLGRQDCCLTALQIFDGLRAEGKAVGIASVYRVLESLVELRVVQQVAVGDGQIRFEPAHRSGEHHHHVVCDGCGKVESFEDPNLEQALHQVEARIGYRVAAHEVVLHGACASCAD
jgi:Fur family ferric uptake transcriptional regulator